MATHLKEVDVLIVGMGWAGGIMAKELAEQGLQVVGLERGAPRSTAEDFSVPHIRDELKYSVRMGLMQDVKQDTLTFRNNVGQRALPMRKLSSFLPGEGVGGSGTHWNGLTWRWSDMEFKVRSMYEERYGKQFIPSDMNLQDWGVSYAELEPYYDRFEYTAGTSGQAGNLRGRIVAGGNPYEAPRRRDYPLPPLTAGLAADVFRQAGTDLGYNPFPTPASNASRAYTNLDGIAMGQCQYCGFCDSFGCEANAKASPHNTVIQAAQRHANFTLRTHARVTRLATDASAKRVTGVEYIDLLTGQTVFQPAALVILSGYTFSNVHLLLRSNIGKPYDPQTQTGLVGKNYCYNTGAGAMLFFEDKEFNPFLSAGGNSTAIDDYYTNWNFDRAKAGFIGGSVILGGHTNGRPIGYHPVPPGTPRWGQKWKEEIARWYSRTMPIIAMASVMPNRYNYLDLDPDYRTQSGDPMLRLTFDFPDNEHRVSTHAAQAIDRIARAANPTHVTPPRPNVKPYGVEGYQGTHNTGGAIMGMDPSHSVVNKYGQHWDYPNLFVTGGAIMPHNAAYNPTGTIGALTFFAADAIRQRYLAHPQLLV
ncbi:GMC family oxidoreductase [Paraburkholderia sp. BCC1886]|uniref:GMC family oxidoreductase n=1 Tax=Paraburkholderia sp. BCC1886 TaxID=2562670 RepID=UPI001642A129|nr:GMC family oxidoreductase [Paraburkholderia sp. BCC1886]